MSYQVLYRTYRPTTFDEVVGQEYIVKTLKNAIKTNRIAHAYLFCGPRGTGKTSIAKLFAKAVNCTHDHEICGECENCKAFINNTHPDIIELDAASNNSVDNIREIVDKVKYAPILGKYKVYIIDEVHMLSGAAFNALLKTLEEPPANVIFILATTEPNKVIPTVMSRCQRYNFSKVEPYDMRKRILYILNKENIPYDDRAVDLIISLSDGGMRDVLSILEQVLAYGNYELRVEDVIQIFGLVSTEEKIKLLSYIKSGNVSEAIKATRNLYQQGIDIKRLTADLIQILKEAYLYLNDGQSLIKVINQEEAQAILNIYHENELVRDINELLKTLDSYKNTYDVLSYFEITLFKLAKKEQANLDNNEVKYVAAPKPVEKTIVKEEPKLQICPKPIVENKPVVEAKPVVEEVVAKPVMAKTEVINEAPIDESYIPEEVDAAYMEEALIEEAPVNEVPVVDEKVATEEDAYISVSNEFLLSILVRATREIKMEDIVIYQKLDSFNFDPEKKRYANMIKGSEIFADSEDAILFKHTLDTKKHAMVEKFNNQGLYWFLKNEFGIDKMPYCIDDNEKKTLIEMFRHQQDYDLSIYKVERYTKTEHKKSTEDVLLEMFGDKVKIED